MSTVECQRMKISAAPDEEVVSGFVQVKIPVHKRSMELASDNDKDDHHRHAIHRAEEDAHQTSSSGDDPRRRKIKKDDKSWRRDNQPRRTNEWDSEWGPSSSCDTSEEKYIPVTMKLREPPEFMKPVEEEGMFDRSDMEPVKRTTKCWDIRSEFKTVNV
eukprot:6043409-Amphidinium_carterae.1